MKKIVTSALITAVWFLGIDSLGKMLGKLIVKIVKS